MIDIANVQYRLVIMDEKGKQYNIKDYVDDLGWEQGEKRTVHPNLLYHEE